MGTASYVRNALLLLLACVYVAIEPSAILQIVAPLALVVVALYEASDRQYLAPVALYFIGATGLYITRYGVHPIATVLLITAFATVTIWSIPHTPHLTIQRATAALTCFSVLIALTISLTIPPALPAALAAVSAAACLEAPLYTGFPTWKTAVSYGIVGIVFSASVAIIFLLLNA